MTIRNDYPAAADALRACVAVLSDRDADGIASAAIAARFLGWPVDRITFLPRGENAFNTTLALPSGRIAILDGGIRAYDRPALFVDHHAPEIDLATLRDDQFAISGFGEPPGVSTSVMMRRIVPDAPAWLAAVGASGDYGDDGLKQPECAGVVKSHVKKLVPLVNAPRRCPDASAVVVALAILMDADSPKAALADPRIAQLEAAKAAYQAEFDRVVRTAPKMFGPVSVIRFASAYQVHPLVAQTWSRRLAPRPVLAASDGYLPGRVNFAMRVGNSDVDLRKLLRDALPDQRGEYGNGHSQATGGSLTPAEFERLLAVLAT